MAIRLSLFLLAILLASCASDVTYRANAPLSGEEFVAKDELFSGSIPRGWFAASPDGMTSGFSAWLVNDEFSASIIFKELQLNDLAGQRVRNGGLKFLATLSYATRVQSEEQRRVDVREFSLGSKKFCSYELPEAGSSRRVVVFILNGRCFESEAVTTRGRWSSEALSKLFTAQQTVLSSLSLR